MATTDEIRRLFDELRTQRDDLRVRMHLAKAEVRDAWDDVEQRWQHARAKLDVLGTEAGDAAKDVAAALRLAGEELKKGYERVRRLV